MKNFLILLLTLTLILGVFASCGKKYVNPLDDETSSSPSEHTDSENITGDITESNETNQSENYNSEETSSEDTEETTTNVENWLDNYNYTIEKIDGKYYMVWNDYFERVYSGEDINEPYTTVRVNSLYDLKYEIPRGNLGDSKKDFIYDYVFKNNYTQVPMYDVEHIWQPTMPDIIHKEYVEVIGLCPGSYCFQAYYSDKPEWLGDTAPAYNIEVLSKESYDSYCETYNQSLLSFGYSKKELRDGDKELTVYNYSGESPRAEGVILHSYVIYVTNGQYYGIINITLDYQLTDEELLEFGFEEYLG